MSPAEREVRATEVALTTEFRAAIDDGRDRIAAVLVPACPTSAFLAALRDEVQHAVDDPPSVPYPELADAEAYWEATVKPQSRSLRDPVAAIVEWLEQRIITTMEVAETDLKVARRYRRGTSRVPTRPPCGSSIAEEVEIRCMELHHQMAEVLERPPGSGTTIVHARAAGGRGDPGSRHQRMSRV